MPTYIIISDILKELCCWVFCGWYNKTNPNPTHASDNISIIVHYSFRTRQRAFILCNLRVVFDRKNINHDKKDRSSCIFNEKSEFLQN